jgi:GMP synthase (glutamine-hydrolysing)
MIDRWLALPTYRHELATAGIGRSEEQIRADTRAHVAATRGLAESAFNNFLDLIGRPNRRVVLPSRGMPASA